MDLFNIIVGIFSVVSTVIAAVSYIEAKKAKGKAVEVQDKLLVIERHIQSIDVGGRIQAGGHIVAGKGIHAHGGKIGNE